MAKKIEHPLDEAGNATIKGRIALKNRLWETGIKSRCCEKCGQGEIWNGMRLVLQLDHIDGNNDNNHISNLMIVCPNCHSQTPTFAGRNPQRAITIAQKRRDANSRRQQKNIWLQELRNKILSSGVELEKFGWVGKISPIVGLPPQKIGGWMKRNLPDIYERCFKRQPQR